MKDSGSYANPINSSFQKFRTTSLMVITTVGWTRQRWECVRAVGVADRLAGVVGSLDLTR